MHAHAPKRNAIVLVVYVLVLLLAVGAAQLVADAALVVAPSGIARHPDTDP